MLNQAFTINHADLIYLINYIKQAKAEHAIFSTTEIKGLKEDLVLSEARETIKELEQNRAKMIV
ncbi:Uncharacterised protein [Legionella busanensis]|uniref:Uncharacterized protein n=1 Tax=Legionella busanensis TaxID=190655 RepID=A0A378JRR4_9GAMM|nr:hypothetical protein [Legionella busanensis]STX52859.1 Uncharacterised protein [Legionella busanensis]